MKENSVQIRQYQELVSELIGIFKEQNFLHELSLQVPEATVANLPARLCCRWAKFVEGKPKLSTWNSFANWLEKEAKISESKQRWIWRRENGSIQIQLTLIGVSQLINPHLGCLQEPWENLYVPAMEQTSAQFTSLLITLSKSAKVLGECSDAKRRKLLRNINNAYVVYYPVII